MPDDSEYIEAKIVGGECLFMRKDNLVGFCHFPEHKGYITKNVLKNKECAKKECFYFQKFNDNPYWEALELQKIAEKNKKEAAKQKKRKDEKTQERLVEQAQEIADGLGYTMKIYRVSKLEKNEYAVFYTSNKGYNDYYDFFELAVKFGKLLKSKVRLKHIKDLEGNYVVELSRNVQSENTQNLK